MSRELPVDVKSGEGGRGPGSYQWTLNGGNPGSCQSTLMGGWGSGELPVDVKRGWGPGSCQWSLRGRGSPRVTRGR